MSDFDFYDKEPKKSGRGFLIAALIVVSVALAGVLVVQYIVPSVNTDTALAEIEATQTADPTETPVVETVAEAETDTTVETVTKVVSYVESGGIPDIVEEVGSAVVGVLNYTETTSYTGFGRETETIEQAQSSGSGVIISSDGYIVTNYHVIEDATRVTVILTTGEEITAEVIGSDEYVDLAVLKIDKTGLDYMTFGDSESSRVGELAIAIGYPLTDDFSTTTVTAGILSAVGVDIEVDGIHFEMLQTDAPINPGNSGGALVDGSGQLIGINTLKTVYAGTSETGDTISAEGIGYAIPSHVVEPIVEELIEYGEVIRPFIGISGRIVSEANSQYYGIPQGMYIDELTAGGPAEQSDLQVGDIITAFNGEEVVTFEELYAYIMSSEVGEEVTLTIYRYETDETMDVQVVLGSSLDY